MLILANLRAFAKRHAECICGIIITIVFSLIGLWLALPQSASVAYRLFSDTSIVDVNDDIPKLDVRYDGKSIPKFKFRTF